MAQKPDLTIIHEVAYGDIDGVAIATAVDVLRTATERLESYSWKGNVE